MSGTELQDLSVCLIVGLAGFWVAFWLWRGGM